MSIWARAFTKILGVYFHFFGCLDGGEEACCYEGVVRGHRATLAAGLAQRAERKEPRRRARTTPGWTSGYKLGAPDE